MPSPILLENTEQLVKACNQVGFITEIPSALYWLVGFILLLNILTILFLLRKKYVRDAISSLGDTVKDEKPEHSGMEDKTRKAS